MQSRKFGVFIMVLALWSPLVASAEDCQCFCGSVEGGAVNNRTAASASACDDTCEADGLQFVGCYDNEDQYPVNSDLCWTKSECDVMTMNDVQYTWTTNVPDCPNTPEDMGHCYAPQSAVNLIVAIGDQTEVEGIGDYVNTVYQYLVPVMALVAVVMVMIAGLQYILARGNSTSVKKAKLRITNAVVGVILLLSVYAIARIVDPRLVNFEQLRTPAIKKVTLIDENSSCEKLASLGFVIDGKSGNAVSGWCGEKGRVDELPETGNFTSGTWSAGDQCNYSSCATDGTSCLSDGHCYACDTIIGGVAGGDLLPSETVCAEFEDVGEGTTGDKYFCRYFPANDDWGVSSDRCVSIGNITTRVVGETTGEVTNVQMLDCDVLQSQSHGGSCRDYDTLMVGDTNFSGGAGSATGVSLLVAYTYNYLLGYIQIPLSELSDSEDICTNDPCGLSPRAGENNVGTGCVMIDYQREGGTAKACVSKIDGVDSTGARDTSSLTGKTCYSRTRKPIDCLTGQPR